MEFAPPGNCFHQERENVTTMGGGGSTGNMEKDLVMTMLDSQSLLQNRPLSLLHCFVTRPSGRLR